MILTAAVIFAFTFDRLALGAEKDPSYKMSKRVPLPGNGGWDWLTFDSETNRLYISHQTMVLVFDAQTQKVIGDINNTQGVHGITIAHPFNKGFISDGGDDSVTVFDLKTLKETARIKVGNRPDAVLFDSATNRVFVFNGGSKDCNVIDPATDKIIGSISPGGKPEFAVSDENGRIFVNLEDKSEIAVIDARKMSVIKTWSLSPGQEPSGLAIDKKNMRLFSVCSNGKMVVVDSNSGEVIATLEIGQGPDAAAFDPQLNLAFSPNGKDGTLTIVKQQSPQQYNVIQTVATVPGARTMALDPKTHTVYLVTAKPKAPAPGQPQPRRRTYEPGTFELLIVAPSEN